MTPVGETATVRRPALVVIGLVGLGGSVMALALAPLLMPDSYSWLSNTTSESAAQGVSGAWLGRLGLLLFGLSVLVLAAAQARTWPPLATALHASFGALLAATAAFSTRSWVPDASFDRTEDALHSVAATAMGFAFALGVVTVLVTDRHMGAGRRSVGITAVSAAVVLPLGMSLWPAVDGVLQRAMFAVAYLWYAIEVLHRR
jgi:hypothetical protein